SHGTYTMIFDPLGRATSQQGLYGQSLTMGYDAAGDRTEVDDSLGGTTTSLYDPLNRLTDRHFGGTGQTPLHVALGWTAQDQLGTVNRYDDHSGSTLVGTSSYSYDSAMRATALVHKDGSGNALASYLYGYDAGNRLTSETVNGS